jgi:cation:H+ antiporter
MLTALLLLAGAVLLLIGAELLVRGASRLAAAAGVPSLVIGLTVVAFGTSAPELAVSLGAALAGQPGIAVGNVVGSNIFNVLFILGVSALIVPLTVQSQLVRLDVPVMMAASVALLLLAMDGAIGRVDGVLLCAALAGYTIFLIRKGRADASASGTAGPDVLRQGGVRGLVLAGAIALAGLGLLVVGSRLFVDGAVLLATRLGVSDVVIGLTIVAAGTSLPEVATSVLASLRRERDIAIGNVVGSNIFNILGILGVCGLVTDTGVEVAASILAFDLPVTIAVALVTLPIFFTGMRISRGEGALFLGYYVAYTAFLILDATRHDALAGFSSIMLFVVLPATLIALLLGFRRPGARAG